MAALKSVFLCLVLALQLLCSGFLAHALPASDHSAPDDDGMLIPHQFMAYLADNYTLESHWQRIGVELNISYYLKNIGCYFIDFNNSTITHDLSESSTLALIRSDPNIEILAPNRRYKMVMADVDGPPSKTRHEVDRLLNTTSRVVDHFGIYEQKDAPWPLRQISDIQKYSRETSYYYLSSGGAGVTVYVMDTGLDPMVKRKHNDRFFYAPQSFHQYELDLVDHCGHGTHVAGLVGSAYFGVAKSCTIISVKVANVTRELDLDNFANAVDWVIHDHEVRKWIPGWNGTIINMSLGVVSAREEIKAAIRRADLAGIVVVNAAGNGGMTVKASNLWLANSYRTITVAASLQDYEWLRSSNYGEKVDIVAPGGGVESWWLDGEYFTTSGTSMAAPHVAGVIALWMGYEGPMNRETAMSRLLANADREYLYALPPNTPDLSLNNGYLKGWVGWPYAGAPHP